MKYLITRKDDGFRIRSENIKMIESGVWILDDIEHGCTDVSVFLPWHNVLQINVNNEGEDTK